MSHCSRIARCALAAAALTVVLAGAAVAQTVKPGPASGLGPLKSVQSWGYQLQELNVTAAAASPYDVLVVDYSRDGTDAQALTADEVKRLKLKPDGTRRVVLSYLSIGEAEAYRYYWRWHWGIFWGVFAPSWRSRHNTEWGGNYAVRYWLPEWHAVLLGSNERAKDGYLDRIIAAGFDGVYLDKIDSSLERIGQENPNARADMIALVRKIADKGRAAIPGFLIVPQNGEELLAVPGYRTMIDALGKEDLLYGEENDKQASPPKMVERRVGLLQLLVGDRKPVFVVEYLDDPKTIAAARARLSGYGFVPHFADRSLDNLRIGDLPEPGRKKSKK